MEEDQPSERRRAMDDTLFEYLAAGWSHEQCAAAVGVSVRTIQRRLRDEEFRRELAVRRTARMEQLTARLCAVTDDAVGVIIAAFESEAGHVRLRAADLALTWALRTRRELDLEARVAQLEASHRVLDADKNGGES